MHHYPLTLPQQGVWLEQLLYSDIPLYNIGGYVHMRGVISPVIFEQSVNLLIQQHDTLRITVSLDSKDGSPQQTYLQEYCVRVPLRDFSQDADPQTAAHTWMRSQFVKPFKLIGQPLFRYDLVKVSESSYYFLMQYHHLIVDGWTVAFLTRILSNIYTKLSRGKPSRNNLLSFDVLSYRAFIEADQRYAQSQQYEQDRKYWINKYHTPPSPLFNPRYRADFDSEPVCSSYETLSLSRDFYQRLNEFAQACGTTLFRVLLGAFYIYFTRTEQRDDFSIGIPKLNRADGDFKETAGLFANVNPTLLNFGRTLTVAELLRQIDETLKIDAQHQHFPITEIKRDLSCRGENSSLFDITLSYQRFDYNCQFDGVDGRATWLFNNWEQTPLAIYIQDFHVQTDVKFDFVYNRAYFQSDEIKYIQDRVIAILEAILDNQFVPIQALPIVTDQEQEQLQMWSEPQANYRSEDTLVTLFEQQVAANPGATAVRYDHHILTYAELNAKANHLAHYLQSLRGKDGMALVQPGSLVALYVERSLDLVVAILGILKSGAAYVPIDPAYPPERVHFILTDSATSLLVTQTNLHSNLPKHPLPQVICLDEFDPTAYPAGNPLHCSTPSTLAYVIYTSGSTGKPKGCLVTHHNVTRLFSATEAWYGFNAHDVWTLFHSYAFDFSVWELWGALLYGGCIVVVPYWVSRAPDEFYQLLVRESVTVLNQTPSAFRQLVQVDQQRHDPLCLRYVIFGGEALNPMELKPWFAKHGDQYPKLVNMYGITETTVHVTHLVLSADNLGRGSVIGQPIPDLGVYVLDESHRPLPIGIPGEMYVAGGGVSEGYLNRPELTAERFINLEVFDRSQRVYKTGDLARWRPDGQLEYLGRIDQQVKLRGFRIELGEIESVITQYPDVRAAVVILLAEADNPRLIAYVTLSGQVASDALKLYLRSCLPDYMLPAHIKILDQFPLTPNGKVDRQALTALNLDAAAAPAGLPRNHTELQLIQIWKQVLQVKTLGIHDNFFELGGHSLLAVQLTSQIQVSLGCRLPVSALFTYPTIAALALALDDKGVEAARSAMLPLQPDGEGVPLYCLPGAFGFVTYLYPLAAHLRKQPCYGIPVPTFDDSAAPLSIAELAKHHLSTLQQQQPQGPYRLLGHSYGGIVAYEMAWQLEQQNETVSFLALLDVSAPGLPNDDDNRTRGYTAVHWLYDLVWGVEEATGLDLGLTLETLQAKPNLEAAYGCVLETLQVHQLIFTAHGTVDELRAVVASYRRAIQSHCRYRLPGKVRCPIHVFRAAAGTREQPGLPQDLGWSIATAAEVNVIEVPGNHETMVISPNVEILAQRILDWL